MSRKESEYVADCDSCRGRTAKPVVDGAKCPSCSTGHFRLRPRSARDGETLSDEPLDEYEREHVTVWIAQNPSTAWSAMMPRIWSRLESAEKECAALRAEVATTVAHRDAALAQAKRLSDENDAMQAQLALEKGVDESLRAECARLATQLKALDPNAPPNRPNAARAAAPTPGDET